MTLTKILSVLSIVGMAVTASPASAAAVTGNFTVSAQVAKVCKVTNPANIDLGAYDPLGTGTITGNTQIQVQCVKGTSYDISLTSANSWKMKGGSGTDLIAYTIKQHDNTTDWTTSALAVSAVPNSAVKSYQANASAAQGQDVPTGSYTDTVTVTVTY